MSRVVKLINNDYLDSTSVVHNKKPLNDILDKLKPIENVWYRNISSIGNGTEFVFNNKLEDGIYNLWFVRSVNTADVNIPVTFAIIGGKGIWVYLNSIGWCSEANADIIGRRNINIISTKLICYGGGYNLINNGVYVEHANINIPYKIDCLCRY